MKKLILLIFLTLTLSVYSQDFGRVTLEPSFGLTKIQDITPYKFANYNLGARYMFNNKFGVRVTAGYTNNVENYYSGNIQGVINVGRLLNFEEFTDVYTILFGFGGDFTYLNKNTQAEIFRNYSNNHFTASIDNLYKINNNVALKASLNIVTGANSDSDNNDLVTTNILGINFGFSYSLGKKEPIDWYVEEIQPIIIDSTKTIIEKPIINNYITEKISSDYIQNEYVFFDNDKSEIKASGLNAITKIVNYLLVDPTKEITLIGYASNTDNTTTEYDDNLSKLRAMVVFKKLVELGISEDKLTIKFKGKDADKESTSFDLARRVELIIQ